VESALVMVKPEAQVVQVAAVAHEMVLVGVQV
jgi:hypothetical protein